MSLLLEHLVNSKTYTHSSTLNEHAESSVFIAFRLFALSQQ